MHCLNRINDELHDYAATILARMTEHLGARPISLLDFGGVDCAVLHRLGDLQAEIVHIDAGERIPMHCHPGVDSIDLLIAGTVDLTVGEIRIPRPLKRLGVRIQGSVMHGGVVGPEGVTFMSCQRWRMPPSHIGMVWRGEPSSMQHMSLLNALEATA